MKKNYVLIIYSIVLAVFFILTGAFAVGTTASPETYWLASVKEWQEEKDDSYFTLDLDRSYKSVDEDGKETTEYYEVAGIYVYVGKVYSKNPDGSVEITFDFKAPSSDETKYVNRVNASVKDFYGWQKVYGGENGKFNLSRVKIHTPDSFELCEVAFTAEDGTLIKIKSRASQSDTTKSSAARVFDEQSTFTSSKAYMYNLTDEEKRELEAADALFNGGEVVGNAPLSTLLNAVSVLIFGRSTFGIRFFSLLAGYISLIILYLLIKRLFADDYAALFGSLTALFAGSLFSGAITATWAISLPFILAAYYTAVGFYAAHYQFSPIWAGVKNLVLCGVFIGLAVASGASNIIVLAGIPVIWGLSLYKLNAEYKKAYDSAKGLDKEKVYSSQRKKIATCVWALPLSFIVLPVLALLLFYAITYKPITAVYGEFFGGIINDMGKSFIASGSLSRLGVLIGYGSEKANGAYKLINYIPYSLALVGLILTTAVAAFYKAEALKGIWQGIRNKYKIITVMAIFSYLPLLIGINLSVCGIAAFSCAYIAYIILGVVAIEKMLGKNLFKGLAIAISVISFITFAGCFFGSFGFEISDTLKNVFYMWQV